MKIYEDKYADMFLEDINIKEITDSKEASWLITQCEDGHQELHDELKITTDKKDRREINDAIYKNRKIFVNLHRLLTNLKIKEHKEELKKEKDKNEAYRKQITAYRELHENNGLTKKYKAKEARNRFIIDEMKKLISEEQFREIVDKSMIHFPS